MRIMVDTNVLISAILFPKSKPANAIKKAMYGNRMVICSYVLEEVREVFLRKFPERAMTSLDTFLLNLAFDLSHTPSNIDKKDFPHIRDIDDLPVLASAMVEDVDVLLTGDKDFLSLRITRPVILTPDEFLSYHDFT